MSFAYLSQKTNDKFLAETNTNKRNKGEGNQEKERVCATEEVWRLRCTAHFVQTHTGKTSTFIVMLFCIITHSSLFFKGLQVIVKNDLPYGENECDYYSRLLHSVLSCVLQMPGSKGFMFRNELQTEAQPLCDKSFTVVRPTTHFHKGFTTITAVCSLSMSYPSTYSLILVASTRRGPR